MLNELADDELLNVPLANLQPGELRRAFQVQALADEKKRIAEIDREWSISALQRRQEEETNHEHEELRRREAALLASLQEREQEIDREASRLDARTIKLDDGRRAYVDGDRYRDEQGRELRDADRAQAEQHHLDQPRAATWQEHEEIERQRTEEQQLRQKVQAINENDPDAGKRLAGYEKELQSSHETREAQSVKMPNYGSGDYMAELSGLSGAFSQAGIGLDPGKTASNQAATQSRNPNAAPLTLR